MVVPAYPSGAEMVKRSCVSRILFGRGRAGAIVVGTGTAVVGKEGGTAVGVSVGTVVGSGVGVGGGWTVWVHPAVTMKIPIAQHSAISNEVFIPLHRHMTGDINFGF
jgi:hypothetical protein